MPATANELRIELAAKIARPALLALGNEYSRHIASGRRWRLEYFAECDRVLDQALDTTDVAIIAHTDTLSVA